MSFYRSQATSQDFSHGSPTALPAGKHDSLKFTARFLPHLLILHFWWITATRPKFNLSLMSQHHSPTTRSTLQNHFRIIHANDSIFGDMIGNTRHWTLHGHPGINELPRNVPVVNLAIVKRERCLINFLRDFVKL